MPKPHVTVTQFDAEDSISVPSELDRAQSKETARKAREYLDAHCPQFTQDFLDGMVTGLAAAVFDSVAEFDIAIRTPGGRPVRAFVGVGLQGAEHVLRAQNLLRSAIEDEEGWEVVDDEDDDDPEPNKPVSV